jgi:hypothetical protein
MDAKRALDESNGDLKRAETNAQEALDSAPGTFGAPNAARQAAKVSDARNARQDAAAAAAAGEPHS